jgi:hypothetical protein
MIGTIETAFQFIKGEGKGEKKAPSAIISDLRK